MRTLIFDFDGTIADTLHHARRVLNELADEHDFQKVDADDVAALQGMTIDSLTKHLGIRRRHIPVLLAKGVRRLRSHIGDISPCEGMADLIEDLHARCSAHEIPSQLGILSSNSVENIDLFLRKHDLRHAFAFISSTSKLKGKAKHLKAISRTFSVPLADLHYIGDEVRDIRAAHKAGVPVTAVTWGFNNEAALRAESPTHIAATPAELAKSLI